MRYPKLFIAGIVLLIITLIGTFLVKPPAFWQIVVGNLIGVTATVLSLSIFGIPKVLSDSKEVKK